MTVPGASPGDGSGPRYTVVRKIVGARHARAAGWGDVNISCPAGMLGLSGDCAMEGGSPPETFPIGGDWRGTGGSGGSCPFNGAPTELRNARIGTVCVSADAFDVRPVERE